IVNLNNSRNLFIIGICFFAGLSVPYHFNPMLSANAVPIDWSAGGPFFAVLGNISQAILTTGMAVTALLGIVLDNFLPGASRAERGLEVWENEASDEAWEEAEAKWAAMKEGEMRPV
ncbi:MAG: hypothetical protein JRF32_13595, partial [Deltaproteobacteria bacterium]|nr:hypothetical protein [Deltaproteobacteria bacterium]